MERALTRFPAQAYADWELVFSVIVDIGRTVDEMRPGSSVAFLFQRPGSERVSEEDMHWADMVLGGADMSGVPVEPFFRANDTSVVEIRVRPGS